MKKIESFDKAILLISVISLIVLGCLTFDFKFCSVFNSIISKRINEIINDLFIGIICSSIFYFIVQWWPNYIKRKTAYDLNKVFLNNILINLEGILSLYSEKYLNNKIIDKLEFQDFIKIEKNYNDDKSNFINDYNSLKLFIENINENSVKINENSHLSQLPEELIAINNNINTNFYKILYKIQCMKQSIQIFTNVLDGVNINSETICLILKYENISKDLDELYLIYKKIRKFSK
ncbi:hypothetical protein [Faecalibacter macacae]|nr:hypothetical protein [Faecalibacter macacae]